MDLTSEDSLENVLSHIDFTMQYGEDEEPKEVSASLSSVVPLLMRLKPVDMDEGDFPDMD